MKKHLFLFFVMLPLNLIGMEKSDVEQETQEISPIESIPDEILVMVLDLGMCSCLAVDDAGKLNFFELNDLGKAISKLLTFCGNIELVSKRFKRCEEFIVRNYGIAELDDELWGMDESKSDLIPDQLEIFKFLSSTIKIKAVDFMIKHYKGFISHNRRLAGLKKFDAESLNFLFRSDKNRKLKHLFDKLDIRDLCKKELKSYRNQLIVLLAWGADPNLVIKYKQYGESKNASLFCVAIEMKKSADLVRFLLFRQAYLFREVDLNLVGSKGRTPLILALFENNYDLAKCLLDHGADANICDKKDRTPLMIVIRYCKNFEKLLASDLLNKMIGQGIDINVKDNNDRNVLYEAILKKGSVKVIDLLCKYGLRLNGVIKIRKYEKVRHFGQVYNIRPYTITRSALGWAVYCMNKKVVELLLDRGASINGSYNTVQSVIEYARKHLNIESNPRMHVILQMLIDKEKENLDLGGVSFCNLF